MRTLRILPLALAPSLIAACGDSDVVSRSLASELDRVHATIHIESAGVALAAVKDVGDGWRTATQTGPTSFEATVHGPYLVTVVCQATLSIGIPVTSTLQFARTLEDSTEIAGCPADASAQPTYDISGTMLQAGSVAIDGAEAGSETASWEFHLAAAPGQYDLLARSDANFVLRRGVVVVDTDVSATPAIDVAQGSTLVGTAFTATNALADEFIGAAVTLRTPHLRAGSLFAGAPDEALVAPNSALSPGDAQLVSLEASTDRFEREIERPFRVGQNTAFTLPPRLEDVTWTVNGDQLSVRWCDLPAFDTLAFVYGGFTDEGITQERLEMSEDYVDELGLEDTVIDTDIPGYQAAWRASLDNPYERVLTAARRFGQATSLTVVFEDIGFAEAARSAGIRAAPPLARLLKQ